MLWLHRHDADLQFQAAFRLGFFVLGIPILFPLVGFIAYAYDKSRFGCYSKGPLRWALGYAPVVILCLLLLAYLIYFYAGSLWQRVRNKCCGENAGYDVINGGNPQNHKGPLLKERTVILLLVLVVSTWAPSLLSEIDSLGEPLANVETVFYPLKDGLLALATLYAYAEALYRGNVIGLLRTAN